jgi:hypothetical protein
VTEHPGEQFPPDVDPDVEPGFDPYPSEDTPETPDYDTEPAPENFSHNQSYGEETAGEPYGGVADEVDSEAAFEASLDEPAPAEAGAQAEESAAHVDPAEVEFGPEFARAPGQEHEHSYAAESAVAEHTPAEQTPAAEQEPATEQEPAAEQEPAEEQESAEEDRAHPLVEETMGRLGELRDRPVAEHAEVYADLHERLQSALVEADADSGDRG